MSLMGVCLCATAISFFKIAALGLDPFQSLMSSLNYLIPVSFGTLYVIVNLTLLIFSLCADRRNIGIATFCNLFLAGYITQFTYDGLKTLLSAPSLLVRVLSLVVGIIGLCFGMALYMTADLGVSAYDAVAIILSGTWKIGEFRYVRMSTDFVCVISGAATILLTGETWKQVFASVGVGTIIAAFFMGPLIELFKRKIAEPMLHEKSGMGDGTS